MKSLDSQNPRFQDFIPPPNSLFFYRPSGIPTGHPLTNSDWPWELMHDDLMWAMEKLQNPNSSSPRELRMAADIAQAWMGEANMRVFHQENASNIPVDA